MCTSQASLWPPDVPSDPLWSARPSHSLWNCSAPGFQLDCLRQRAAAEEVLLLPCCRPARGHTSDRKDPLSIHQLLLGSASEVSSFCLQIVLGQWCSHTAPLQNLHHPLLGSPCEGSLVESPQLDHAGCALSHCQNFVAQCKSLKLFLMVTVIR